MEFIVTDDFFILQPIQKGETNLWISRENGQFDMRPSWDLASQENPECLGLTWALVGKLKIHPDLCERLVLVSQCERIGELPGPHYFERHGVYKVTSVVLIPIVKAPSSIWSSSIQLRPCPKHQPAKECNEEETDFSEEGSSITTNIPAPNNALSRLGGSLKVLASDAMKTTAGNAAALASQVKVPWSKTGSSQSQTTNPFRTPNVSKVLERFEKRMIEQFTKLFSGTDSFFFSFSGDITNTLQRQMEKNTKEEELPLWKRSNDKFFFNKHLLQEVMDLQDSRANPFIVPILQGYIEIHKCPLVLDNDGIMMGRVEASLPEHFEIALISRRSRHRAGTRYKRRGVDSEGHVANYVETEQILLYHHYAISFVLVRGSVPVFWSQPGYKYRPPPRLDKTAKEDKEAFRAHIDSQTREYGTPVVCVNLAERTGREKVVSDAFLEQALEYDSPDLLLISFDFHEYCRGMRFENVSVLIEAVKDQVKALRYCWMDSHGIVCAQEGVFRVNCIDCLDRTNVVQTAIARLVLESQLTKLGVIQPEQAIPLETRMAFRGLWANNGDVISRQYAGTNALKGDFTRTGERNITGMMKDGVNSASRYYLNQFRDAYRQGAIDLLTGVPISERILLLNEEDEQLSKVDEEDSSGAAAERVRVLIDDCKKLLITDLDQVVGSWGLIDNDPYSGDLRQEDMDVIFILTKDSYFVAYYEAEMDKIIHFQKILLTNVDKIEFGVPDGGFNLSFGKNQTKQEHSMRIFYRMPSEEVGAKDEGYYHMLRSTNLRFFNNIAVEALTVEEQVESLKTIADSVAVAMELSGITPNVWFGKLDKKKSRVPDLQTNYNLFTTGDTSLKSIGSRALSNVTNQMFKLTRLRGSTKKSNIDSASELQVTVPIHQVNSEQILNNGHRRSESPNASTKVLLRRQSRSHDELSQSVKVFDEPSPRKSHEEELLVYPPATPSESFIAPFVKITHGMQSLGQGAEERPKEQDGHDVDGSVTKMLTESKSKTKVIIL